MLRARPFPRPRRALLAAAAALLAAPLAAQPAPPARSAADSIPARIDQIFARYDHVNAPGCALGVSRDGKTVYERGYGMSNLEHAIAITPQSIFHVASISKQFTAFAILLLEQDGRLSLDDDVRKYVPELPKYAKTITIDHLLHHTSGLRDQWALLGTADWREDDLITEEDVMRVVTRQKALNFDPGEEYLYSNTGFTLLAVIVKRVSGKSLRDFADERIFRPLGMAHTHFHDDHTMIVPGRTQAYQPRPNGGWAISIPVFDTYGATSLFTTTGDLLRWEQNFADGTVGGAALLAKMTTPGTLTSGQPIAYARGLLVGRYRGLPVVGHGGADAGYRADVVRFPEQGLAVATLCNLANVNPTQLSQQVAEVYLGAQMSRDSAPAAAAVAGLTLDSAQLARYAGNYWDPRAETFVRLSVRNGRLVVGNGAGTPLTPTGPDRFTAPNAPEVAFVTGPNGVRQLRLSGPGRPDQLFTLAAPFAPTGAQLAAYAGRYVSDEIDTRYTLALRGDTLLVRSRRDAEYPLRPMAPDIFQSPGLGTVRFTRTRGAIDGFVVSSGRVRRLRFDREGK